MPVMKRLTVGGVNYDTVGEASVTQVLASGTKIATVVIDGTATDLYAPEGGGSGPEPSSTTPAMDGTAAVGTSTDYARADHVHPTDTSRQETLVSGTNIKTINSTSLLGSGNVSVVSGITFDDSSDTYAVPVNGGTANINLGDGLSASDSNNKVTISADVPSAGSTAPKMDGTAAVGTSTSYARADHVHPTDTSRAAASHTHAIADVTNLQSALDGKQGTLVSGTSIKTVNGTSLLGSGNISTAELPSVTSSDNGKVLMVVGGVWQVASMPLASSSAFGVVKVDGTTITATDGVISTAGGAEAYEVTITLTNPSHGQYFNRCDIYGYDTTAKESTVLLGEIDSPTGSATVEYDPSLHEKLSIHFDTNWGTTYTSSDITCTGGVSFYDFNLANDAIFNVEGDGTITIDGIDYGD